MVKKPTIAETIKLNRLRWFGHVQRMEENRIPKKVLYEFGNNKAERQTEKQMARRSEEGWKTSWWKRMRRKSTQQRGMEEAPENGKELSHSAHASE